MPTMALMQKGEPMKMGYTFRPNVAMKNQNFTHLWNWSPPKSHKPCELRQEVKRQFVDIYVVVVMIFFQKIVVPYNMSNF